MVPMPPKLRLTKEQIGLLRREDEVRRVAAGEVLFREGDRGYDFIVILAGRVAIVDHQAETERELAPGEPGQFVAELGLLTGERLFTTAVVTEPAEVLAVPVARLHAVIGQDQGLGQWIIRTMFARRQWLMQMQTGMRIVGSRSSPQTRRLLEFAVRNRLPHVWLDTDTDLAAGVVLAHHNTPVSQTPVVVMRGGEVLRQPSNAELARAAGIGTGPAAGMTYDVAIIGAGPAGLAAAVYGASEGLSTALVDAVAVGGQIGTTSRLVPARQVRGAGVPSLERLAYLVEAAQRQLQGIRHMVLAGARSPVSFFAYPGQPSDLVPGGASVCTLADGTEDVTATLEALADRVAPVTAPQLADLAPPAAPTGALDVNTLAAAVGATLPENVIVVDAAQTSSPGLPAATANAARHDWITETGGAIGQGLPTALGAAIAAPDRQVCVCRPTAAPCTPTRRCGRWPANRPT
jgi:CRP-like cAMP-binding protein